MDVQLRLQLHMSLAYSRLDAAAAQHFPSPVRQVRGESSGAFCEDTIWSWWQTCHPGGLLPGLKLYRVGCEFVLLVKCMLRSLFQCIRCACDKLNMRLILLHGLYLVLTLDFNSTVARAAITCSYGMMRYEIKIMAAKL